MKLSQTVRELRLHKISASGEISTEWKKWEYSWTRHAYLSLSLSLNICIIKIFQTAYTRFGLEIHSWEVHVTRKQPQQRLSFLHGISLLVLILASTKYYQNIPNHLKVFECTRIWLRNSLSGVIECTRIWLRNSLSVQEKEQSKIVLLACDTPAWPNIYPTKIFSNYLTV